MLRVEYIGTRQAVGWLLLLAALQFSLQAWFFPLSELLSQTPLHHIDSVYHQYQMTIGRTLCRLGVMTGYDPFFAAGYAAGPAQNASAKVPALLACLAGSPDAVIPIYKGYSFWLGVAAPVSFAAGMMALRLEARTIALASACALLLWWTGPMRWYHTAGLVSWVAACYLAVPFGIALARTCQAPRLVTVAACAVGGALGMLLHPLFPVAVALVAGPLVVAQIATGRALWLAVTALGVVGLVTLGANAWWIGSSLTASGLASTQVYQRDIDPLLVLREPLAIASTAAGGSRMYGALLIGAVLAAFNWRRLRDERVTALLVGWALAMTWASLGGALTSVASLQPNRVSALAWLILSVPASVGIVFTIDHIRTRTSLVRSASMAALAGFAFIFAYYVRETGTELLNVHGPHYGVGRPEVKGVGSANAALVAWIRENTDPSARIFFETSLARLHDHVHVAGYLATQTSREFIGGPYPFLDFASAWDGMAFGRKLAEMSPKQLKEHLDRYNIGWMLCHSVTCVRAIEQVPGARIAARVGVVTALERGDRPGFLVSGRASIISRELNRIEIQSTPNEEVVLRYHWVPGINSVPAAEIGPVKLGDDPTPFLRVKAPAERFTIGISLSSRSTSEVGR